MLKQLKMMILGCGYFGSRAAKIAIESGAFSEIVIVDYAEEEAKKLAAQLNSKKTKVTSEFADLADHDNLVKVIKGADVVLNFVGPYYKWGISAVKAAIDAGVNYVDISDDFDETLEVLELDKEAKAAGITVITGIGLSPGLTNIVARAACDKLDEVDDVELTFLFVPLTFSKSVHDHFIRILSNDVPQYLNGKWVNIPALTEKEHYETPDLSPIGIDAYITGHPEPVTFPRFVKCKNVTIKGGSFPDWFMERYRNLLDYGMNSTTPIKVGDAMVAPRDFLVEFLASDAAQNIVVKKVEEAGVKPDKVGARMSIRVSGKKSGKTVRYVYYMHDRERRSVYETAAIGAEMLAQGEIKLKGVIAPEAIENPQRILNRLAHKGSMWCTETREGTETLIPI